MSSVEISRLHKHHHDDYDEAKAQIAQAVGSLADIEVFGRQIIVGAYVRPNKTAGGFYIPISAQKEDIWQGKAVLVLRVGPDAFTGNDDYVRAVFGPKGAPVPGDWVFLRSDSGLQVSLCGDGAERVKGKDHRGEPIDLYDWDGWPCRIVADDSIIGRINKPHTVV